MVFFCQLNVRERDRGTHWQRRSRKEGGSRKVSVCGGDADMLNLKMVTRGADDRP